MSVEELRKELLAAFNCQVDEETGEVIISLTARARISKAEFVDNPLQAMVHAYWRMAINFDEALKAGHRRIKSIRKAHELANSEIHGPKKSEHL